jgi:hypothetical protein
VNHTAFTTPLNGETVFLEDKYLCIGTVPNVIQCVYNIYIIIHLDLDMTIFLYMSILLYIYCIYIYAVYDI